MQPNPSTMRRSRPKRRRWTHTCMELIRSVSLFTTITKLIALLAFTLLLSSSNSFFDSIFIITDEQLSSAGEAPTILRIMNTIVLMQLSVVCACGIYGYARMNRHMICYYGASLVIFIVLVFFITIIVITTEDRDIPRKSLFLDFNKNMKAKQSVEILQNHGHCCGSEDYRYEDLPSYPPSCCPNLTKNAKCGEEDAYPSLCETNRTTFYLALKYNNALSRVISMGLLVVGSNVAEASIAFYVVWRLGNIEKGREQKRSRHGTFY